MNDPGPSLQIPRQVRLFPLGGVVLFPHGILPLHIFEPRYRQLTADALDSDRTITMVLPRDMAAPEPVPLHSCGCIGTIHQEARLPDGRYTLMLRGVARVSLEKEVASGRLYRAARVREMRSHCLPGGQQRRLLQRAHILACARPLVEKFSENVDELTEFLSFGCSDAAFTDLVAYWSPLPIVHKQLLLSTTDVDARLEILAEEIAKVVGPTEGPPSRAFGLN